MKKFFSMMMIAAAALFAACGETPETPDQPGGGNTGKLETPAPTAEAGDTFFTVSWEAIANADSYTVNLSGKNYTTTETSYKFENLNKGVYTVRVKATGKGYKDSDFGSVAVTLTGATSVDWFTQTAVSREDEVAIDFVWKGVGVKSLKYGIFTTETANAADEQQIIDNLYILEEGLEYVNSDEGFAAYYDESHGLYGSTAYSLFAYVTNNDGISFLDRVDVVTAEAKASEATQAWLGNWTAYTEKIVSYEMISEEEGDFVISDKRTDINMSIALLEGTSNQVVVYGLSNIGYDVPAYGTVGLSEDGKTNCLYIWSYEALVELGDGYYAFWLTYCSLADGNHTFVLGQFPAWMLLMDEQGNVTCDMYSGSLQNGAAFTAQGSDVFGFNPETGSLIFMTIDEENGIYNTVFNYGPMKDIKAAAAAQSVAAPTALKASNVAVSTSVVAM